MYKARLEGTPKEPVGGPPRYDGMVLAKDIDPDNVPDGLKCPCCDADVHYRKDNDSINGGVESRAAIFATNPGQRDKHEIGCTYVSQELDYKSGHPKNLREAIERGSAIRANLNFIQTGVAPALKPGQRPPISQELERWKRRYAHDYWNKSIKSAEDYVKLLKQTRDMVADMQGTGVEIDASHVLDKLYVHFDGHLQKHSDFSGGQGTVGRLQAAFQNAVNSPVAKRSNKTGQEFNKGRPVMVGIDVRDHLWGQNKAGNAVAIQHYNNPLAVPLMTVFETAGDVDFMEQLENGKMAGRFMAVAEPVVSISRAENFSWQHGHGLCLKVRTAESLLLHPDY